MAALQNRPAPKPTLLALVPLLWLCACGTPELPAPTDSFVRIYDAGLATLDFEPLDIAQTPNGQYIMLAHQSQENQTLPGIYLLGATEDGTYKWGNAVDNEYGRAISTLIPQEGDYLLFCIDQTSFTAQLLRISAETGEVSAERSFEDYASPLAASQNPDGTFLLLHYNAITQRMQFTKLSTTYDEVYTTELPVVEDITNAVADFQTGFRNGIPFFTGSFNDGSAYYVHTFVNFSLQLQFMHPATGSPMGSLTGFRSNAGVSQVTHLGSNLMSLTRFGFGEWHLLPNVAIDTAADVLLQNMGGTRLFELPEAARLISRLIDLDPQDDVLVYGTDIRSGALQLQAYGRSTGLLRGQTQLGQTQGYRMGHITQTADGGLAVVASTFVAARFPRLVCIKLSAAEAKALYNVE